MSKQDFINSVLEKGKQAEEKVRSSFSNLTAEQLNWKPAPEKWSIGECLHHLIRTDRGYFPILEKITSNNYKMSFWQRASPFSKMWGGMFKKYLQENVTRKLKAPGKSQPSKSEIRTDIIDKYNQNLSKLLNYVDRCRNVELEKTIITSPMLSIVTYNLHDVITFLIQHEHRHINQAMRVKESEGFPNN